MSSSRMRRAELSQNFLRDVSLVRRLVQRAGIEPHDVVLEIGPGEGVITRELAREAAQVLAVERDPRLVGRWLQRRDIPLNVILFEGDILAFPLPGSPFKVFANIPFRVTSAIVSKLTTGCAPPDDCWLVVQAAAAMRYVPAGERTMQGVLLWPWFDVTIEHRFRRNDFRPPSTVDCVLLRLRKRAEPRLPWDDRARFSRVVEAVISRFRPTIRQSLSLILTSGEHQQVQRALGAALDQRPGQASDDVWIALYRELTKVCSDRTWSRIDQLRGDYLTRERRRQRRDSGSR